MIAAGPRRVPGCCRWLEEVWDRQETVNARGSGLALVLDPGCGLRAMDIRESRRPGWQGRAASAAAVIARPGERRLK